MGGRLRLGMLAAAALLACGCPNPLLDKVKSTVAQKYLAPKIAIRTASGGVPSGGTFDFETISINTSKDVTFTIDNTGTSELVLTDTPKVSISGTDAALYTVLADPSSPIAAGQGASFVIRFLPTTSGSKSATVTVPNSDTTNGTYSFALSGAGSVQPAIRVLEGSTDIPPTTGEYSFAQTGLTYSSTNITFTIRNIGTAPLALSGTPRVQVSGDFSVFTQPPVATVAALGGETTFVMRFTPSGEGSRSAVVTIPNDDPDRSPFTFTVKGIASTVLLPKTGQTTLWVAGDDGDLEKGASWPTTRFTPTSQTIVDNLTGLQWMMNANLISTNFSGSDTEDIAGDGMVSWQTAITFISSTLNGGAGFDGHTDWRLPNRDELRSLGNYGVSDVSSWLMSSGSFLLVKNDYDYWTSTTNAQLTTRAYGVRMATGRVTSWDKATNYYYVWPVRNAAGGGSVRLPKTGQTTSYDSGDYDDGAFEVGAAWPASRFIVNGDGTITDNLTGLMWEQAHPTPPLYPLWANALGAAAACTTGGHTDWRLPNVNELDSLLNAEMADTSSYLNGLGFTGLTTTSFWTGTTNAAATGDAWFVFLGDGQIQAGSKTGTIDRRVIMVRSTP